jgi:hypothetical protein
MIYIFLLENKPFTKENIKSYQKTKKKKDSNKNVASNTNFIMSPSKNSFFSPYKSFLRGRSRKSTIFSKNIDFSKILENTKNDKNDKNDVTKKEKESNNEFKRKVKRRRATVQYESNIINLKDIQEEEERRKKIKEERVKDLTRKKKQNKDLPEEQIQIKPAFKQKMKKKEEKSTSKPKIIEKIEDEDKDTSLSFDMELSSSDDNSEEGEEEDEEILKTEGFLYKLIDGKMRELYFKLVHKDLYFYKKKGDEHHKGMHNLSGLFLQKEKPVIYEGENYYSFSVVYPTKTRIYYCKGEKEYNEWFDKLKIATGYTNLLDIYEIKNKLGCGKFGLVKLGIDKKTGQKVAIKIMKKSTMDSSDLELVRTEIEILKICQHPYIIKLYDIFENIDYIYIIMEFCSGGDLFSFIKKRNFMLKEEKVVVIMYKLCKAVYYVHSYGIAHRDIKPENVLLTSESEDADIRLLDFGLSKIVGPNQKCTEPYGTLTYCAPEIILDKPYLKTVDSWSLGVMTYLMLSGSLPFSGKDEHEIAKNVVYSKVNFEKKPIWKEISNEAKDFITKLLEKDLKKRIEMKEALEHPWFKKFHLQNEINENNTTVNKSFKKANSIQNDFGIYTSALKK